MLAFLEFRSKQIYRIFAELGLVRFLILCLFFAYVFLRGLEKDMPQFWTLLMLFSIFLLQIFREDKKFLRVASLPERPIYALEYLVLSLPFFLLLLFSADKIYLLSIFLLIPVVFLDKHLEAKMPLIHFSFVPVGAFEWIVGFRKYGLSILLLILGSIFGAFYHVLIVPILYLFLLMALMSFSLEGEPAEYLLVYKKNIQQFLWYKISTAIVVWTAIWLIGFVVFVIFHAADFWLMLLLWAVAAGVLAFCQLSKYAFYVPNSSLARVQIFNFLIFLGLAIPFLMPLSLILGFRFYKKAVERLALYLD